MQTAGGICVRDVPFQYLAFTLMFWLQHEEGQHSLNK